MASISQIQASLLVHSISNPPAEDLSCNADITLKNDAGKVSLIKVTFESQTEYILTISDPGAFGFRGNQLGLISDYILASNLALNQSVVTTKKISMEKPSIEYTKPDTRVKVETTPTGNKVSLSEFVIFSDSVHITIGFAEDLDINQVMGNLSTIRKVDRTLRTSKSHQHLQMAKSLLNYESSTASFDRLAIFKNMYTAVELATNSDGTDRDGSVLDSEISTVASISQSDVETWRNLNNRIKHLDRTPKDSSEFVQGIQNLPTYLQPLRTAANTLILSRLIALS